MHPAPPEAVGSRLTPLDLIERYDAWCAERIDIQVLRWILASSPQEQWEWLQSIGVTTDPALAALVPPIPPIELRRITAAPDVETFLWSGFKDLCTLLEHFEVHQRTAHDRPFDVLDFGCGCGRLTRFFPEPQVDWRASASDINPDHVAWCQDNLPAVMTVVNGRTPPLPFDDASFDFVMSLSVFTHLPDSQTRPWLAELARIVRPGGVVLITTHGAPALRIIADSPAHQEMFHLSAERISEIEQTLAHDGYAFQSLAQGVVDTARAADGYGNSFVGGDYIRSEWARSDFSVSEFVPGGLRGWQDISVLRPQ